MRLYKSMSGQGVRGGDDEYGEAKFYTTDT